MSDEHRVTGVPLKPKHAQKYLLKLFSGKSNGLARREMLDPVLKHHKELGGVEPTTALHYTIKKALSDLKIAELAQNSGGYWWFRSSLNENFAGESITPVEVSSVSPTSEETHPSVEPELEYINIGKGKEKVYAYYYPTYRKFAEIKGEEYWPIKIGKTSVDVQTRVSDQGRTSLPEKPFIALIWNVANADRAERFLHGIMKTFSRRDEKALGSEWFLTNPEEIKSVIENSGLEVWC